MRWRSRIVNDCPRDLGLWPPPRPRCSSIRVTKIVMLYGFGFIAHAAGQAVPVLPFFNLVMVWNPGDQLRAVSGHADRCGTALLALFSAGRGVGLLGWWLWNATRRALAIGLGLVIGGALGNLIDRLIYGKVADFFHFYAFGYDWYVFNVADAAITFGVIALLYDALLKPEMRAGGETG